MVAVFNSWLPEQSNTHASYLLLNLMIALDGKNDLRKKAKDRN